MKPLYSSSQFSNAKSRDRLPFICYCCKKTFLKEKHEIQKVLAGYPSLSCMFCSRQCSSKYRHNPKIETHCKQCEKIITVKYGEFRKSKSKNFFCSRSCAATYNNLHKTTGTRRSKLENWIEEQLTKLYPNLQVLYNDKKAISSELDIYIPSLKLAFELNGIYHYEPIHGKNKLASVQNNDSRKFQACLEQGIELCIIDTSSLKNFKEQKARKYLDIITSIVNQQFGR